MKNSSFWLDILKGMVIGLANIIPGVSGGTMMVSMGIYDKLIWSITHLFSDFKKAFRFLLPIFIGIALALALLAKLFEFLLVRWPVATNLGFCGLIAGSLPGLIHLVRHKKFSLSMGIAFAVFFILIIAGALFSDASGVNVELQLTLPGIGMLMLVGIIAAATMVIPGVSGSMILMLMGYYEPVIDLVSSAVDALIHFDLPALLHCVALGLPFALGVVIGIFAIARLIEWVMHKWRHQTYWAILGLVSASPIAILISVDWAAFSWMQLVIGLIAFAAGFLLTNKLSKE